MLPILSWLTGKIVAPVMAGLAVLLLCVTIWQTIQLYGFRITLPVFGHIVLADGALAERDAAVKALDTAQANAKVLSDGLDTCNASVTNLAAKGQSMQADAQKKIDALSGELAGVKAARGRLDAVPKSADKCPSVDAIFQGAFGP